MDHLERNDLLYEYQMGFRKGKSTAAAISKLVLDISLAQNKGDYTIAVFIDYCKAFNCVRPDILMCKLLALGVSETNIGWFNNYFIDRFQRTQIKSSLSRTVNIT